MQIRDFPLADYPVLVAVDSGHDIANQKQEVVIEAIIEMIRLIRKE